MSLHRLVLVNVHQWRFFFTFIWRFSFKIISSNKYLQAGIIFKAVYVDALKMYSAVVYHLSFYRQENYIYSENVLCCHRPVNRKLWIWGSLLDWPVKIIILPASCQHIKDKTVIPEFTPTRIRPSMSSSGDRATTHTLDDAAPRNAKMWLNKIVFFLHIINKL